MKTFQINKEIKIEAEHYETRYSWGHKAWLYLNDKEIAYKKITYYNRTWESYEFQTILFAIIRKAGKALTAEQIAQADDYIRTFNERDPMLNTVAMVAKMGEFFGQNQKEKNDWKTRMLKAGLEHKGLIIPEDWDELDEEAKQVRLDKVIAVLDK